MTTIPSFLTPPQRPNHQADLGSTSGQSPGAKLAAIQPVLERVRRGDHWRVPSGGSPSHRSGQRLTDGLLEGHFAGEYRVGACPMERGSSTTRIALLDLDSHKDETDWPTMAEVARRLIATAAERGIRFTPFKSSGGKGLHLYAIWDDHQDARSVRAAMSDVLAAHDLKNGTKGVAAGTVEIFPKQSSVPADGWGNQWILPLTGQSVALDPKTLEPIGIDAIEWPTSDPVAFVAPPPPVERTEYDTPELSRLQSALDALDPNTLDYGGNAGAIGWLEILFAVHDGTAGSAEGLAMMHDFSARWLGYDVHASEAETVKQWTFAKSKPGGITVGTLFRKARAAGWVDPLHVPDAEGFPNLVEEAAQRLHAAYVVGDWTPEQIATATPDVLAELEKIEPAAAREAREAIEKASASSADEARERAAQALAEAGAGTAFPEPFRGPMAAAVEAALLAAYKPQPTLTTLAALIGMAACLPGHYRLPDGGRLNLYGLGALETGGGKDFPRKVAQEIAANSAATIIGGPASGQALEDALVADRAMLVEVDEVAHVLSAMSGSKAPSYVVELGRRLLALFSASSGTYHCRARAVVKQSSAGSAPRSLKNPCVSFLGFATPSKLGEALTVGNIEDGLLGRMLFAFGDSGTKQRRVAEAFALPKDFERYRACFDQSLAMLDAQTGVEVVVQYGEGAEAMHDALLDEFNADAGASPFSKALRQRAVEKILRVAGVLACFGDPLQPVMRVEHLDWAAKLVRASNGAVEEFVGQHMHGGLVQANAARVLNLIDRVVSGEVKVQRSSQLAAVRSGAAPRTSLLKQSKLDKRDFDDAMAHLIATGDVVAETFKHEDGRDITCFRRASE